MSVAATKMPTMTRLGSDSFWPSGAIDTSVRPHFSPISGDTSAISPLTLPRGTAGFFDQIAAIKGIPPAQLASLIHASTNGTPSAEPRSKPAYSPLSPNSYGPGVSQPPSFLSPHLSPLAREAVGQPRSNSLPPYRRDVSAGAASGWNGVTSPTGTVIGPRSRQGSSASRSSAVNGSSPALNLVLPTPSFAPTSHPHSASPKAEMIRRLEAQNGKIREAWEAERKYLQANRERAEEVYKEERALMEEERAEWEAEKAILLQEIERLHQLLRLGGDDRLSRQSGSGRQTLSPQQPNLGLRGGAWGGSPERMRSPQASHGALPAQRIGSMSSQVPPSMGLNGFRATSRSPQGRKAPVSDFLAEPSPPADEATGPIPIVDVQEIHPELEGIPIKATTLQKSTFADIPSPNGSRDSSRSSSPPNSSAQEPPKSSKEQTLQVLAADETDRLTMHAGHTPNHSLSALPTIPSTGCTTRSSSGGDSTPTLTHTEDVSNAQPTTGVPQIVEPYPSIVPGREESLPEDHPEAVLEPSEDRPLKGPLMVRNMPAHDEIFFQKLSDKLEVVSKDEQAALPAVLKDAEQAEEAPGQQLNAQQGESGKDNEASKTGDDDESEDEEFIPLKLKPRLNFGVPFGALGGRKPS